MPDLRSQIEVVDDRVAELLRRKSGPERLALASSLFAFVRGVLVRALRAEHPDWDERRVAREAARRLTHGAI